MGTIIEKKVEDFDKKIAQLKAKQAAFVAKQKDALRKIDTRRKILIGAYFYEQYKNKMPELSEMLDPFLTRDDDRKLFDLQPKSKPTSEKSE